MSSRASAALSPRKRHQLDAAKAGIGIAVLPCYLADGEPNVTRLMPPIPALTRELWLVTHSDLRNTARVRAFFDLVTETLARQPLFAAPALCAQ